MRGKTTRVMHRKGILPSRKSKAADAAAAKSFFDITKICELAELQAKLFLQAIPGKESQPWKFDSDRHLLAGEEAVHAIQKAKPSDYPQPCAIQPYVCNPLLFYKITTKECHAYVDPGIWSAAYKFVSNVFGHHELVVMNKHLDIENLPPHAYASCRTMFVTQPPVKEVLLDIRGRVLCPTSNHCRGPRKNWQFLTVSTPTTRNAEGVRFGEVVDAVRQGLQGTWDGQLWNMRFVGGLPVSAERKAFVDADGEVTKETDLLAKL
ncbi:hypothetical protein B0A55_02572 [Friedmanniomyces simplex]|uniref:Uncharacterized protein n=1 Tax=Friedmanniomyces simplex TaxID=329884 RepID=A0A4U0XJ55_9PEZI|nr:hypothetical protein B0A55_02572 [Friedmanniomyces simplex]